MENEMDALLAILLLKPLLEYFWVFNNPVKVPQWTLPSAPELKEFFPSPVPTAHRLDALLAEFLLFQKHSLVVGSPVHSLHLLNAHLAELSESSVILVFSNSQQSSFLCAPCALCSMPTWQSSTESSTILSATVFSATQPCLLRCSTTLRSSS
jgi:hypothetical protein